MALIPRKVYNTVENHLYERYTLVEAAWSRLIAARERAFSVRSPALGVVGGRASDTDTKTERDVQAVAAAEEALQVALKWCEVFRVVDRIFEGKTESAVADALYVRKVKQCEAAKTLDLDRRIVSKCRDAYVAHCALLAAERGLIHVTRSAKGE